MIETTLILVEFFAESHPFDGVFVVVSAGLQGG
jgi:hypothetical protein